MKPVEYEKLVDMLTKRGFDVRENGEELLAIFYPPTIEEAGGEGEMLNQRYYVIKFKIINGLAYYDSTTLMENDKPIKILKMEEVQPWLESLLGE
ncbi:hypothetical protein SULI_00055 [Saccharolobus solfataricus]|uniref:Uncharacterized protein n=2 Tax=Saccharolobus solfataricus TaxID=2287 RepID=A0A0E3GVP3_SACSO|nr:hypothetical protein SULB_0011 [Saccharolobus solfataricus]AKA77671.1 hypothetical protein SULC_0010 [Saccharolobus solfataricus]AKA77859.1 hypothetical protein SULA_0010 [Saccharolobus solfataricus]AZF66980.1 hypothetical protein SULG_00055 [Saccharolobus solfataricus]AZF69600.1 hypothetical protein SULH_00055 [Saccharolobus solfataricus]